MTPMIQQYRAIKTKYQDAILFFRLGDFYEMFFDDAIEASKLLQITLTARNKGENKTPMCGVPYHSAQNYITKLTKLGKKVAICEQVSDPRETGIVDRDVVRVITPGTTLDDNILEQKSNHYLLAIAVEDSTTGFAFIDLSTGELNTAEVQNEEVFLAELDRIRPVEIIISHDLNETKFVRRLKEIKNGTYFFIHDFQHDASAYIRDYFGMERFETASYNSNIFGIGSMKTGIAATALLLDYLKTTQKNGLVHVQKIHPYNMTGFMAIDCQTLQNLELLETMRENKKEGSLLWVLDKTVTAAGGRKLRFDLTHPFLEIEKIRQRLDAVEEFFLNPSQLDVIRQYLKNILDFERLLGRLSLGYGNARDLVAIKNSLLVVPALKNMLRRCTAHLFKDIAADLDEDMPQLVDLIGRAVLEEAPLTVKEGNMIKEDFHADLDELKKISREGKQIIQQIQQNEIQRTGIGSLKIRYNQVFGYYIEISKTHLASVPQDYIRKQTLVNAERFVTPALKEYEEKVLGAEEKIKLLEYEIFVGLREEVVKYIPQIQKLARAIAHLDVIATLATVALENRYCKPIVHDGFGMNIAAGRHPVVEKMRSSARFVANDTIFHSEDQKVLLITGPNMGGKSTYLRQVALITLMAHIGSFVPADRADIGIVDRIFTRVGASDNLARGQSTFMVEMQETAHILHHATAKSLIILDEIGRGTSTYDGMSIAWAIMEFIHDTVGAKTLFATHYHELIALAEKLAFAKNYSAAVKENAEEGVVFLYKIIEGGVDKSYGIEVAKLAGLPSEVLTKARKIMTELEEGITEPGIQKEIENIRKHQNIFPINESCPPLKSFQNI